MVTQSSPYLLRHRTIYLHMKRGLDDESNLKGERIKSMHTSEAEEIVER
jgi:hypothetical protein